MTGSEELPLHVLTEGERVVVFSPTTLRAVAVAPTQLESPPDALSESAVQRLLEMLDLVSASRSSSPSLVDEQRVSTPERWLDRLVLHLSNDCNLRCVYCYAAGGSYQRPRGLMTQETAFAALNWALSHHDGIGQIQFFGGEPLLNLPLLAQICEYCQILCESGRLSAMPRFSLVSNGVLGTEAIRQLLRHYQVAVTLSIDGPQEIHDRLRGRGSFAQVDRFAQQCLADSGVSTTFECTWTRRHLEQGLSVTDLMDFFFNRYGENLLHVVAVCGAASDPLQIPAELRAEGFAEAARYSVHNLARGIPLVNSLTHRMLDALTNHQPLTAYCPAGWGTLAVSVEGEVYPCFMFTGQPAYRLCCLHPNGSVTEDRTEELLESLARCQKETRPICADCWARTLCTGCLGADLARTGDWATPGDCATVQAIASALLLELAEMTRRVTDESPGR